MRTDLTARRKALQKQVGSDFVQLRSAVDTLSEAVQDRTDIGRAMQRQPYAWLGCAVLVGLALGVRQMPFRDA